MKVRPQRSITAMCGLSLAIFLFMTYRDTWFGPGTRQFAGVGGQSEFVRQRIVHLQRLRKNVQVIDPVVRQREIAEIDRQLAEIGQETVQELDAELKVERFLPKVDREPRNR